jgi:hypothetical protein
MNHSNGLERRMSADSGRRTGAICRRAGVACSYLLAQRARTPVPIARVRAARALQRQPFSVVAAIRLGVFPAVGELADVGEVALAFRDGRAFTSAKQKRGREDKNAVQSHGLKYRSVSGYWERLA